MSEFDYESIARLVEGEIATLTSSPLPDRDAEIFAQGYLDSLNILHIIMFLESTFSIKIDLFGVNLTTLGSINKITHYVEKNI